MHFRDLSDTEQGAFTETPTRNFHFLYFVSRQLPRYNKKETNKKWIPQFSNLIFIPLQKYFPFSCVPENVV